jgi:hypothetical protein
MRLFSREYHPEGQRLLGQFVRLPFLVSTGIIKAEVVVEQVIAELVELNKKVDVLIDIIQKPESKFLKLMEVVGNIVGIIGILAVIDIIRNWLLGG